MKKLGSKKTTQAYVPENLEYFAKSLVHIRDSRIKGGNLGINMEGLQKAIMALPRKDRENIEHFWGLKGGINHSKKLVSFASKDIAFVRRSNEAVISLRTLFRLDFLYMYDEKLKGMITYIVRKIDKRGIDITDIDAIKYLMAFLVVLQNGPKMSFEATPMSIDTKAREDLTFDEYSIVKSAFKEFHDIPDQSINLKLICDLLNMLDFKDALTIKKSFGIKIPKNEICGMEIEPTYTLAQIRNLKERVFSYGCWEVSNELILGNTNVIANLGEFMKCLDTIRKDWSKVTDFKVGQRQLRTYHELRNLDVYNIGGLEFTDIYEIMFLYLERKFLGPEN